MDAQKTGALIRKRRMEMKMTQAQLAGALHVSDKAVSKWERGLGCPDVSLMSALSAALGVDAQSLMLGSLNVRKENGGNMRRICFYVCPVCGNVITATAGAQIACCSRKMEALKPRPVDEAHSVAIAPLDDERYLTFDHPMDKAHYIRFIACVGYDRVLLVRLYPEQGAEVRVPFMPRCSYFVCCSEHGLYEFKS